MSVRVQKKKCQVFYKEDGISVPNRYRPERPKIEGLDSIRDGRKGADSNMRRRTLSLPRLVVRVTEWLVVDSPSVYLRTFRRTMCRSYRLSPYASPLQSSWFSSSGLSNNRQIEVNGIFNPKTRSHTGIQNRKSLVPLKSRKRHKRIHETDLPSQSRLNICTVNR